jgi:DNA-binding GntR family transcriptional regulator
MTPEGMREIERRHAEIRGAIHEARPPRALRLNKSFHFAIHEQSSPLVQQCVEALWVRFTPPTTIWTAEHAEALQLDHDDILDAIRRGDAAAATRLTADHVRHAAAIRDEHPELRATGEQDREDLI